MGHSRTVTYSVHYEVDHGIWTPGEWHSRRKSWMQGPGDGKPTNENLKKHCLHYEESTQPGRSNDYIGPTKILKAKIVDQRTQKTVATYEREPETC